jgi:glycosyltransferase involved in cell wall biosynthesis
MKNIVILIDQLYSYGGIERLVAIKANYWVDVFNYNVTIISTEQKNEPLAFKISNQVKFIDLGINYDRNKSYFKKDNLIKFIKNVKKLKIELNKLNPDFIVVASHIPITYFINFIKGRAKTIKEIHFTKFYHKNSVKSKIETFLLNRYDYIVVLSQEEKQYCNSENVVVIPNPFIESKSDIIRSIEVEKKNKAIFLGRIAPVKNLEEMINIWSIFIVKQPGWILEIYGDYNDPYGEMLKNTINRLKLENTIFLKGPTSNALDAIVASRIMLLTSHQECFPLVILESLSMAVPVYSYDCPTGPRNILTDGFDGRIIENKNSKLFAEALLDFAENEVLQKQFSKNALTTAQKYSLDKIMSIWNNKIFRYDSN